MLWEWMKPNGFFYIVTSLECRVHLLSARYQKKKDAVWFTPTHEGLVIHQRPLRSFRSAQTGADRRSALRAQRREQALTSPSARLSALSCDCSRKRCWERERERERGERERETVNQAVTTHTRTLWFMPSVCVCLCVSVCVFLDSFRWGHNLLIAPAPVVWYGMLCSLFLCFTPCH